MATSITNTSVTTDDLTVDTNVLKVDSTNNRVGIGTATPTQATLHVAGGGVPARFESTSASTAYVQFGASATTNYGQIAMTGNDMTLRTAYQDRMTIDTNGAITTPNQPGCMIYCQSQDIQWTSGNSILYGNNGATSNTSIKSWDTTNSYDMATSQYTVPVSGKYYISFTANGVYASGVVPRAFVRVNGANIGHGQHIRGNSTITGDLDHRTYAGIISLSTNDTVSVYVGAGTWDTFGCNYFSMYKIS